MESEKDNERLCRICLSSTLNLFDEELLKKIIKKSELEKKRSKSKNNKYSDVKENISFNESNEIIDDNNSGKCKESIIEGVSDPTDDYSSEQNHDQLWNRLKDIDSTVIKQCIYDFYYEDNKSDLLSIIENYYNLMIRIFIYISLIPKWINWMVKNLLFLDLWKNPFIYYNKLCFKHNEEIDEDYLSGMTYFKRNSILKNGAQDVQEVENQSEKIYNDDTYKPKNIDSNDSECNRDGDQDTVNENSSEDINVNSNNDKNKNNSNNNNNINNNSINNNSFNEYNNIKCKDNNNDYKVNNLLKKSLLRSSNSLNSLNIIERSIKKSSSIDIPLRKSSSSFFHPFNDNNKSSIGMEKDRNILRSSYMSLDEFFRNFDSNDSLDNENSYPKKLLNQKKKIQSLYSKFSYYEKKIIDQPISSRMYLKFIYPVKVKIENINKRFNYKKNKLLFILNVQKNIQMVWWENQNKIKNYQKKYFFLNRIPEDVSYYIDKLISPCKCKGSQKYVHSYCLDEWRMKTSLEIGQQENCILCRQSYRKKDNNKWYTKLQKKGVQNTILYTTIIFLITFGGYLMKYILNTTYKYLDIGIEYDYIQGHTNSSLWDINIYDETRMSQDSCFFQPQDNLNIDDMDIETAYLESINIENMNIETMNIEAMNIEAMNLENANLYPETLVYSIDDVNYDTERALHEILFSEFFLKCVNIISSLTYHIMAGMFFLGKCNK